MTPDAVTVLGSVATFVVAFFFLIVFAEQRRHGWGEAFAIAGIVYGILFGAVALIGGTVAFWTWLAGVLA